MSETMSTPADWSRFYHRQQNLSSDNAPASSTGMVTAMDGSPADVHNHTGSSSNLLTPSEGRVSKPPHAAAARRRSRASRRTPTTLLNTDTTNFRAMVQQFTGGINTAPPAQTVGFGLGTSGNRQAGSYLLQNPNPNPRSSSVMFQSPNYHIQYQQQQQQPQHHHQGYMISMGSVNNDDTTNYGATAGDGFFQRLGGNGNFRQPQPSPTADGFLMEMNNDYGAAAVASTRAPPGFQFQ